MYKIPFRYASYVLWNIFLFSAFWIKENWKFVRKKFKFSFWSIISQRRITAASVKVQSTRNKIYSNSWETLHAELSTLFLFNYLIIRQLQNQKIILLLWLFICLAGQGTLFRHWLNFGCSPNMKLWNYGKLFHDQMSGWIVNMVQITKFRLMLMDSARWDSWKIRKMFCLICSWK